MPRTFTLKNTGGTHSFLCLSWVFGAKCKSSSKQLFALHARINVFHNSRSLFVFTFDVLMGVDQFCCTSEVHVQFARRKLQAGSAKALGNLGNKNNLEFLNTYETCLQNMRHFPQKLSNFRTNLWFITHLKVLRMRWKIPAEEIQVIRDEFFEVQWQHLLRLETKTILTKDASWPLVNFRPFYYTFLGVVVWDLQRNSLKLSKHSLNLTEWMLDTA
jgi:hypothetical protein